MKVHETKYLKNLSRQPAVPAVKPVFVRKNKCEQIIELN